MGTHMTRTPADEMTDALAALADAKRALRDLSSHLDDLKAVAGPVAGIAHQASRNAGIAAAKVDEVGQHLHNSARGQLRSVS